MVYSPKLLDQLQQVQPSPWQGQVFRHMFNEYPPDRENLSGARWNPPQVAAIYASLSANGALAEAEHQLAIQPLRPTVRRTLHKLELNLVNILNLADLELLKELGVTQDELNSDDMYACQQIGGAVAWLEHDGMLVPSARSESDNLVAFPTHFSVDTTIEIIESERINQLG